MRTSDAIGDLATAMAKAQGTLRAAVKDSVNPAFKSKYADLTAVWSAARGPLTENGLSVWQDVTTDDHGVAVTTRIVHVSGQWVEFGPLVVPVLKKDAHGIGSATSYAKRYALAAAVGVVADDDDDGNAAVARTIGAKAHTVVDMTTGEERPALVNELPPPPDPPPGFAAWWATLPGVADEGIAKLAAAWEAVPKSYRAYVARYEADAWAALKAKAQTVKVPA